MAFVGDSMIRRMLYYRANDVINHRQFHHLVACSRGVGGLGGHETRPVHLWHSFHLRHSLTDVQTVGVGSYDE